MKKREYRVLIAPLDWGLGHATRCMPIIRLLEWLDCEVILAGDGRSLALLRHEFPHLAAEELPSYNVRYSRGNNQSVQMLRQIPAILRTRNAEHKAVQDIVAAYDITHIISDNRYGVWHPAVPSIILTHQLAVIAPRPFSGLSHWLYAPHMRLLQPFQQVWVPDVAGEPNLSGVLAHKYTRPEKVHFIGLLSRFAKDFGVDKYLGIVENAVCYPQIRANQLDIVAVLSGPEPQRSLLENQLVQQFAHASSLKHRKLWIIQGKTEDRTYRREGDIHYFSFMNAHELAYVYQNAQVVISRGGYTSLMDFAALGLKQVVLVPTPGQSEQEYLAEQMAQQRLAVVQSQPDFQLEKALAAVTQTQGFAAFPPTDALKNRLMDWLKIPQPQPQLVTSR